MINSKTTKKNGKENNTKRLLRQDGAGADNLIPYRKNDVSAYNRKSVWYHTSTKVHDSYRQRSTYYLCDEIDLIKPLH